MWQDGGKLQRKGGTPMKIRIQDNSIRFRITLAELETLNATGRLEQTTEILGPDGECEGRFVYGATAIEGEAESHWVIGPNAIFIHLNEADMKRLNDPSEEGVYLKREVRLPSGEVHRSMAFIEKDRPSTRCDKPEEWVYEFRAGGQPETRPIPPRA
jgi:hypothetical protein